MTFFRDLAALMRFSGFRRLFAVRLLSQGSDGIFQVALASTILFSPEQAPTAGAISAAFATILLPFTVIGPFVGIVLDRWSRRRIMIASNGIRAILLLAVALLVVRDNLGLLFYLIVLAAFSVNRFLLAGLSAGIPHVVSRDLLVTANAVSPTCGTFAYLAGLGFGGAVHALAHGDSTVLVVGALSYSLSALLAARLPDIGPDLGGIDSAVREALGHAFRGLGDAARHLPPVGRLALGVVGAVQLPYAVMIVATILLFRNYLEAADVGAGMAGFGVAVAASGAGYAIAALVTPSMTRRLGMRAYITTLSVLAAMLQVFPAGLFTRWAIVVSALGLGITTRGVKICVDTTVQRVVADIYRGRIFVLYDVLFNGTFVAATALAAFVLPKDGRSHGVLAMASLWYLLIAFAVARRWPPGHPRTESADPRSSGSGPVGAGS
ncbi:MAG: MFS transporter [Dermatophilaceae bacterium]